MFGVYGVRSYKDSDPISELLDEAGRDAEAGPYLDRKKRGWPGALEEGRCPNCFLGRAVTIAGFTWQSPGNLGFIVTGANRQKYLNALVASGSVMNTRVKEALREVLIEEYPTVGLFRKQLGSVRFLVETNDQGA